MMFMLPLITMSTSRLDIELLCYLRANILLLLMYVKVVFFKYIGAVLRFHMLLSIMDCFFPKKTGPSPRARAHTTH
jgi:hypothetical protein